MAPKYPYTYAVDKIPKILEHIRVAGHPDAVTLAYLGKAGFRSSHDRSLIPVLKFVGLLDQKGVPTQEYASYRDKKKGDSVLGALIGKAYSGLFEMYGNAQDQDDAALRNFFSTDARVSDEVAARMTYTFRALCKAAAFDGAQPEARVLPRQGGQVELANDGAGLVPPRSGKVDVCVNVQVVIPQDADAKMIDSIFESMARHLGIRE